MTNREMLNKMNNEELAKFLNKSCCPYCIYSTFSCDSLDKCEIGTELWLGREVKENEVKQSD